MSQRQPSLLISRYPGLALCSLHFLVVWNFAVTQPLFDLLSRHAEFFVIRQSAPLDILLFVLLSCLGFPALLLLPAWVTSWIHKGMSLGLLLGLLAVGLAALAVQAMPAVPQMPGFVLVTSAGLIGLLAVAGYYRFAVMRTFFTMLSPGLAVVPVLFLFFSPVSSLLFAQKDVVGTGVKIESPPPIVMVVFDEFSLVSLLDKELQIDPAQYPNFAAFAEQATWFKNTTTVSDGTLHAIPAILTGKYPDSSLLPTAEDHPHNIFTLLQDAYTIKTFGTYTMLCPDALCNKPKKNSLPQRLIALGSDLSIVYLHLLLPPDLRVGIPPITQNWMNFGGTPSPSVPVASPADKQEKAQIRKNIWDSIGKGMWVDRFQQFTEFVNAITPQPQPAFHYLHILLPHVLYNYLPSGKLYSKDVALVGFSEHSKDQWGNDSWATTQNYQRYLLQVKFVDNLLGQLLARLRQVGLYDRSLIIITADHGVSFRNGEFRRQMTEVNRCDIALVPFFIKAPHQQEALLIESSVETTDILPTVAELLGVTLPWPTDGQSALNPANKREALSFFSFKDIDRRLSLAPVPQHILQASVDYKLGLTSGDISSWDLGLVHSGEPRSLVGRPLSDFEPREDHTISIKYDSPDLFAAVDLESTFLPAHITGRIRSQGHVKTPHALAIAVNGTVQAVTRPWQFPVKGESGSWSAIVPEQAFRPGKNEVETFVVSQTEERMTLLRPRAVFDQLPEYPSPAPQTIMSPQCIPRPVVGSTLQGWVDHAEIRAGHLELAGWAADVEQAQMAKEIWMCVNDEFFHAGGLDVARPDVAQHFEKPALGLSGFHYTLPLAQFTENPSLTLRVYAVSEDGRISELGYPAMLRGGLPPAIRLHAGDQSNSAPTSHRD